MPHFKQNLRNLLLLDNPPIFPPVLNQRNIRVTQPATSVSQRDRRPDVLNDHLSTPPQRRHQCLSTIISLRTSLRLYYPLLRAQRGPQTSTKLTSSKGGSPQTSALLSTRFTRLHRDRLQAKRPPKLLSRPSSSCPPRSMWSAPQRVPTPAAALQVLSSATAHHHSAVRLCLAVV